MSLDESIRLVKINVSWNTLLELIKMEKVRIGVIGLGVMVNEHTKEILQLEGANITAVCDLDVNTVILLLGCMRMKIVAKSQGRIFYFRPGHETYPTYYREDIIRIIANAIKWSGSERGADPQFGNVQPLEEILNKK